jgi:uncharacterized protein (TIGR04255 family)
MIDALPRYEPELLRNDQLALAVAQIRFTPVLSIQTDRAALARFQDLLRDRYPFVFVGQQIGLDVGLQGIEQQQASARIYQFADADREWAVSLSVDSVALEARRYTDFGDFSHRIMELIAAIKDVYRITERQRLGLRYINEIHYPGASSPSDWTSLLRHELLGLVANSEIAPSIASSLQELRLTLPGGGLTIRHGHLPQGTTVVPLPGETLQDAGPFYLLDFDAFDEQGRDLDDRTLNELLLSYNHTMFQLLHWLVHDDLYGYLKGGA